MNSSTATQPTNSGRTMQGVVVKTAMKDSATILVERYVKHPKYKKYAMRTKKYLAHDPGTTASIGDKVTIRSCRPLSKNKHFELVK